MPRHKFLTLMNGTSKSFFKALFIGPHLGAALRRMSHSKAVHDGLKAQECKRNVVRVSHPFHIPYIPERDLFQEEPDRSANTLKHTLPHKVELHVPVW